jgi:hypothetical protein
MRVRRKSQKVRVISMRIREEGEEKKEKKSCCRGCENIDDQEDHNHFGLTIFLVLF